EHLAIAALESGKHVLVEKPMANSLAACRRMVEMARRSGRILTVGFNHRYFAGIKAVRAAIDSGAIGKLNYIRAYAGHVGLAEFKAPWMYSRDVMGGGTLVDNGIHVLDLLCHLMGGVDHVSGAVSSRIWQLDVEDNAFALLSNRAGVIGHLHASWSEWKGYRFFIEAYGDRGMARCYYTPMLSTLITMDRGGRGRHVGRKSSPFAGAGEGVLGWQSAVVRLLGEKSEDFGARGGGRSKSGIIARGEDGWRVAKIVEAFYHSAKSAKSFALYPA